MRELELHRAILGFTPPWRVVRVGLDVRGQQVVVRAGAGPGPFACPESGTTAPLTVVGLGASGTPSLAAGFGRGRPLRFFGVAMTEIPFALRSNSRRGRRLTIVGTEGSPVGSRYWPARELVALLRAHGFAVVLHGRFPGVRGPSRALFVAAVKRIGVCLRLVPRTMRRKELLKRVLLGNLVMPPGELADGAGAYWRPIPRAPGASKDGY